MVSAEYSKSKNLKFVNLGPTLVFSKLDLGRDWYRNQKLQAEAWTIAQLGFVEDLPEFPSVLTHSFRFCHNIPNDPDLDCSNVVHSHSWVLPSHMCCLPSSISSQFPCILFCSSEGDTLQGCREPGLQGRVLNQPPAALPESKFTYFDLRRRARETWKCSFLLNSKVSLKVTIPELICKKVPLLQAAWPCYSPL